MGFLAPPRSQPPALDQGAGSTPALQSVFQFTAPPPLSWIMHFGFPLFMLPLTGDGAAQSPVSRRRLAGRVVGTPRPICSPRPQSMPSTRRLCSPTAPGRGGFPSKNVAGADPPGCATGGRAPRPSVRGASLAFHSFEAKLAAGRLSTAKDSSPSASSRRGLVKARLSPARAGL